MKIVLYMAMTVNGYIAKENDDTGFVSEIEWDSFRKMIRQAGNMVVGKRTYEIMQKEGGFEGIEKITVIIVTRDKSFRTNQPQHLIAGSPKEALAILEKRGFGKTLVAGGGMLNSSFMKEGLIDEVYLDIEPVILGRGIQLFYPEGFEFGLELLGINNPDGNLIQLHYRVKK